MALLVIGSGAWANKVSHKISSLGIVEVGQIGARNFLKESPNADVYWIATTPILQIEILPTLPLRSKIIAEKPAFRNTKELNIVRQQFERRGGDIFFSLPWNYSCIVDEIRRQINDDKINCINIIRGGPQRRKYIPPYLDWLPHDLGLLSLFESLEPFMIDSISFEDEIISIQWSSKNKKIHLQSGYFPKKVAAWTFSSHEGPDYELNLYHEISTRNEDPISIMFETFLASKVSSNQLFKLWNLFFSTIDYLDLNSKVFFEGTY